MQDAAYHLRLCAVALNQLVFLLYLLCLFEAHLFGQSNHLFVECLPYLLGVPPKYLLDFSDILLIFFQTLLPDAGTGTTLDVILQTDLELPCPDVFGCQVVLAGTQWIQLFDEVQYGIHGWNVAVWAVVV